MKKWKLDDARNVSGKNVIVTGSNTGLGYETALVLAQKGANVILACRSLERATTAKHKILHIVPDASLDIIQLDLGDLKSIKKFATSYKERYQTLDILINNAGVMTTPYLKTADGFEFQNGINHLGHFALTANLFDVIKNTKESRIVIVSSIVHKGASINFDDYMFDNESNYTPSLSYKQSKLSNLLFMKELNRRILEKGYNITVLGAHPGVSRTELTRYVLNGFVKLIYPIFYLFTQSATKGALPQLRAALDQQVTPGDYYGPNGLGELKGHPVVVSPDKNALNKEDASRLWSLSETLINQSFSI